MLRTILTLLFCCFSVTASAQMPPEQPKGLAESAHDSYGIWQESPNYRQVENLGIRVVDAPAFQSFFAYYIPESFKTAAVKRAIIAIPGTGGTPYAEIKDEAAMADKLGYAVIAIQMALPEERSRNMPPRRLYGLIREAARYMNEKKNLGVSRWAYVGFSVGGAKSYQIAYLDSTSPKPLFSLVVNHSGHSKADKGFLEEEGAKNKPFKNLPFALFCSEKDGEWKGQQCDDMEWWQAKLAELGVTKTNVIHDDETGHMGYRSTPAYHEKFMRWFVELTQ